MTKRLKIIFAGTPEFAAASLSAVLKTDHEVVAVYTQPDRPAGRGRKLTPSPVKQLALQHDIEVCQPLTLRDSAAQAQLAAFEADLMIVVAYGLILPQAVLDTPRLGCINVHASLLPRWRGAAPIHRALLAGDTETGITIMQMDAGLDTGDMLSIARCPIHADDTSGLLHDRLAELGAQTLVQALAPLSEGELEAVPQDDSLACYAAKLEKSEGVLDWNRDAIELERQVRGLNPWPVAYTEINGQTLRVWGARAESGDASQTPGTILAHSADSLVVATGKGRLALTVLQLPGGKPTAVSALLNAHKERFSTGTVLG
ncbi:Methionyl-tRNA formyltransferase [Marinobacterium lacunae]|uniref:Methionyl-tRNA formyltransferase n=1 Tax=Marinobacterium lacunae TaxID=1232683 RepID=A0A081FVC3_9GAMM|nr:methionyl-tRNA formyltransferase [Marinobacterium lacunae]KEA62478.1 Methionyl-tRNA formyltransferase [Marinobacterium lacunae]MBR9882214.1 methionyl-tRNA formyltransferase [Oceanospirillales bacterium]